MTLYCGCGNTFRANKKDPRTCPLCGRTAETKKSSAWLSKNSGVPVRGYSGMYSYTNSDGSGGKIPSRHSHD